MKSRCFERMAKLDVFRLLRVSICNFQFIDSYAIIMLLCLLETFT